jgi:hypothetical protein
MQQSVDPQAVGILGVARRESTLMISQIRF